METNAIEAEKLQLYITITQPEGLKTLVEANPDPYIKSWVCDLRPVVKKVDYPSNQKNIFYMVKYIDQGLLIAIIRTIPQGKPADHLASWIYVPYSIVLDDDSLLEAVKMITTKISNEAVSGKDVGEIKTYFSRSYEVSFNAPVFAPSEGLDYAYRFYGAGLQTLQELLGQYRYQTAYLPFAGVLLVDNGISSHISATNLTAAPLDDMGVLYPPEAKDGYKPMIYDELFDMPYFVPMSRKIEILWHKAGAPDQVVNVMMNKPKMIAPALSLPEPAKSRQPQQRDRSIGMPNTDEPLPWEEPAQKPIHDEAPRPWSVNRETATSDVPERQKVYHFEIPAKSAKIGTIIQFAITTDSPISESPIDGYEADTIHEGAGHSNRLHYKDENPYAKHLANALYALGGLLVGILATLMFTCSGGHGKSAKTVDNDSTAVEQQTAQEAQAQAAEPAKPVIDVNADYGLKAAISYLDSNKTWSKEEMEKYPDLRGLYDDMVNVRHDKIINTWGPKLEESRVFSTLVVKHTRQGKQNHKTPKKVPLTDSNSFGYQSYLNNVDP